MEQESQSTQTYQTEPQNSSIVDIKLEVDTILENLDYQLKGMVWVVKEGKGKFITPKSFKPYINSQGVDHLMSVARGSFTKISMLSNLDEQLIVNMALNFEYNLGQILLSKYETYQLDLNYASVIVDMFGNNYTQLLYRSLEGFEQGHISNSIKLNENRNYHSGQQTRTNGIGSFFKK